MTLFPNFPKLKPERAYLLLIGGQELLMAMIFTASMVYQINQVGLTPLQLVLMGTTLELAVFLFEVPTGVVADVYSRRLSILIGLGLIGLGFILEGSLAWFPTLLLAQVLWGIGYTFTSGATQAWIVDEVGEEHAGPIFLRGAQIGGFCGLAGIVLGSGIGLLAINIPIVLGGVAHLLLAAYLLFTMPEHNFNPIRDHDHNGLRVMARTLRTGIQVVRVHPAILTIFGIGLFYGLYSEGYDRLRDAHLIRDITLPTLYNLSPVIWIGAIKAAAAIFSISMVEVVKRRLDTQNIRALTQTLMGLSALLAGCLLGFALTGNLIVAVVLVLAISALREVIGPLFETWFNQRLDSRVRATVISMRSQTDALGQIGGGPSVGYIGEVVSIRAALITSALLLTPVLALYLRAMPPANATANTLAEVPVEV